MFVLVLCNYGVSANSKYELISVSVSFLDDDDVLMFCLLEGCLRLCVWDVSFHKEAI